jgi:glycosyltransferase involved in cell wall biosynthesis
LHSNSRTTQILGNLLSRKTSIPYISTCHGFFKRRFLRRLFPCWGLRVIAISESVKGHLVNDFAVKQEDIRVIHNGIDIERFRKQRTENREQRKKELGLNKGPVIGIIARLSEEKGHLYLIQAMREVISKIPQAKLLIIGEGRMQKVLFALRDKLGLQKHIFFIPSVADTRDILSVMDIFVLPSTKEGLGLSLMEAMAAGVCVIGADVGGIKSLIQDSVTGLLVKPADAYGLSLAILELLRNSPKRESLSTQGQKFIAQNFSQEKMVLETERVYLECLKR